MAEELPNPFDAVRRANRAVWEQARGRKPEASNLFDAVRRANRAVWEQASGRKPSDESRAIPPPTGRESPLEGADASAMVAALSAKLSALQARVDYIEDDFPETDVPVGEDGGVWTGRVMSHDGNVVKEWDVTDPENVENTHIHYDGISKTASWGDGNNEGMLVWKVAESVPSPGTGYRLTNNITGDIILPIPKDWENQQVFCTDKDGKLKISDLSVKTDDPAVGFVFEKPEDVDDLVQMKATGGSAGNVLVRGEGGGASWDDLPIEFDTDVGGDGEEFTLELTPASEGNPPLLTLGVPTYGKIQYMTGATPDWWISGGAITLRLIIHREEFDMDLREINTLSDIYSDEVTLPCAYCPG